MMVDIRPDMPAIGTPWVRGLCLASQRTIRRVQARTPSESEAELVHWMSVTDANSAGFVHGGVVMRLCDEAAGIASGRHSRSRVVTAGMDRMTFLEPIAVGELVTFRARVNAVWRTSMEVGVRVEAEDLRAGTRRHTNTAYLTMVALDDEGRPTAVPGLRCADDTERRREREAQMRRANRLAERDEIVSGRAG
jgi:acyl-CoA hydrolase